MAVVAIVVVAIVAAAAATLTRKISVPRRIGRKGKKPTLKRSIFTRFTNIKGNGVVINTSAHIRK